MELLASWIIQHGAQARTIELLRGDLSRLPPEHAVDVLVVSAFRDDYLPTPTSLIGALARAGLSVAELAQRKKIDLREQFSCWVSEPIIGNFQFRRLLCIESGWHGMPPEITDDLFRALAPYLITEFPNASVAMPLLGTGDQGWPPATMMQSIMRAAISWIDRGLPMRLLKIVVFSEKAAKEAMDMFLVIEREHTAKEVQRHGTRDLLNSDDSRTTYDVFMSYSHEDSQHAKVIVDTLDRVCPATRVFYDKSSLRTGGSWLLQVAESLDNSRRVVALYTPNYWQSPSCKDEFTAALARQNDTGQMVLFPVYLISAKMPYMFRNLQYVDCRKADLQRLAEESTKLGRLCSQ
jgi:TIR domain